VAKQKKVLVVDTADSMIERVKHEQTVEARRLLPKLFVEAQQLEADNGSLRETYANLSKQWKAHGKVPSPRTTALLDIVNAIQKLASEGPAAKLEKKLDELCNEAQRLEAENHELRLQNMGMMRSLKQLVFRKAVYWSDSGEGPFCPKCCEGDGIFSRLVAHGQSLRDCLPIFKCEECDTMYKDQRDAFDFIETC